MRHTCKAVLSAAALGLMALATAAHAQSGADQGYYFYQGSYYRLVPVKPPLSRDAQFIAPGYTAAAPAPSSHCFLTNFENHGGAHEMFVTMCGP